MHRDGVAARIGHLVGDHPRARARQVNGGSRIARSIGQSQLQLGHRTTALGRERVAAVHQATRVGQGQLGAGLHGHVHLILDHRVLSAVLVNPRRCRRIDRPRLRVQRVVARQRVRLGAGIRVLDHTGQARRLQTVGHAHRRAVTVTVAHQVDDLVAGHPR